MEAPVEERLRDFDWVQLAVLLRQFLPVLCSIEGACMQWRLSVLREASQGNLQGSTGQQQDRGYAATGHVHDAQKCQYDSVLMCGKYGMDTVKHLGHWQCPLQGCTGIGKHSVDARSA